MSLDLDYDTDVDPAAPPREARRGSSRTGLARVGMFALMGLIAIPFVFPVYWMFSTALKTYGGVFESPPVLFPAEPQWHNFLAPFSQGPFLQQFINSLYIATLTTAGVIAVASLAGYAFARIQFRGRNALFVMLLSALLVPPEVTIIPLFRLISAFGWVDSHLSLIVPSMFGVPAVLGIFLMRQFFISLPVELEQAGRVDGLGRFGIFWRIAMPLAKAPVAALAILTFLNSWNDFLEPLVFLRSREMLTIPIALQSFTDPITGVPIWNVQMAATTLSVLPVLAVFVIAQRQFVQGIAGTGIK
ncbi:carbohydrate ABC transporter permease [Microbacterium sp. UBA1612]|uniref:carbohydrate ABC transporter permease n=1 Tax=Microbacterium sp. UBA1612 TaxID=1946942 RepID=UPI00257C2C65|nr:carbohydrate ABC transporter permease [Microbacterium sp. UBA1612]|tara:strand:+ start:11002 stop:11907 length:906 start_codon:yes stop_codon:yes gene_type:complete